MQVAPAVEQVLDTDVEAAAFIVPVTADLEGAERLTRDGCILDDEGGEDGETLLERGRDPDVAGGPSLQGKVPADERIDGIQVEIVQVDPQGIGMAGRVTAVDPQPLQAVVQRQVSDADVLAIQADVRTFDGPGIPVQV